MKKGNRLFALLLALAMVMTYMPALAFAEGEGGDTGDNGSGTPAVTQEAPAQTETPPAAETGEGAVTDSGDEAVPDAVNDGGGDSEEQPLNPKKGGALRSVQTTGLITVNNRTSKVIAIYGMDRGVYGEWTVDPGKTKEIGLKSLDKIYANEGVKVQNCNPNLDWHTAASDKAGYSFCISFGDTDLGDHAFSFDVVSDDNYWVVTFMGNGADSGSMEPQLIAKGSSGHLDANAFAKDGYSFAGWSTDRNASEPEWTDGAEIEPEGNTTLYALWTHAHNWEINAAGSEAAVKCVNKGCSYTTGKEYTATITAEGGGYTGEPYLAEVETSENFPSEFGIDVKYTQGGTEVDPVNVGIYKATATLKAGARTGSIETTFSITEAEPDFDAPAALDPVYNGEDQPLVSEGTVRSRGPKMQYRLEGETDWSDTVPSAADVGSYKVLYKVSGSSNYRESSGEVDVTILPAEFEAAPEADDSLVYSGEPLQLLKRGGELKAGTGGTIKYWLKDHSSEKTETFADVRATDAGDYTVYYAIFNGDTQTSEKMSVTASVAPKPVEVEWGPECRTRMIQFAYDGQPHAPTAAVAGEDVEVTVSGAQTDVPAAGYYTATAGTANKNYRITNDTCTFNILPRTVKIKWSGSDTFSYNGKHQAPAAAIESGVVDGDTCSLTFRYESESEGAVDETVDAGSYSVMAFTGNSNYSTVNYAEYALDGEALDFSFIKKYSIIEIPARVKTAPAAVDGLVYDGTAQALVTAGAAIGGTMVYSLDGEEYGGDIPAGYDAGKYLVYYKAAGDKNHSDSEPDTVEVEIGKCPVDTSGMKVDITGWTYGDGPNEPSLTGYTGSGKISYYYYDSDNKNLKTDPPTEAGKYHVKALVSDSGNYAGFETGYTYFDIEKAAVGVTGVEATDPVYTGQPLDLVTAGSTTVDGVGTVVYSTDGGNTWSDKVPQSTGAGTGTVMYKTALSADEEKNYAAEEPGSVAISIRKADPAYKAPTAIKGLVYNGRDQKVLNDGSVTGGTMYYAYNKSDLDGVPADSRKTNNLTLKGPGTSAVWFKIVGDANHNDVEAASVRVEVEALRITAPVGANLTYNGENQKLLTEIAVTNSTDENVKVYYQVKEGGVRTDQIPMAMGTQDKTSTYTVQYWAENATLTTEDKKISEVKSVEANIMPVGVEPPKARELTYNGKDQELIEAGSSTLGTMEYRKGSSGDFSQEIPKGRKAGNFDIWYQVVNEKGAVIVGPAKMVATIKKADIDPEVTIDGWTYDDTPNAPQLADGSNPGGGEVVYTYMGVTNAGEFYEETEAVPTQAGSYVVTAAIGETQNYNSGTANAEFEIGKAPHGVTVTAVEGLTYNGGAQELVSVSAHPDAVKVSFKKSLLGSYTEDIPTGTGAGSYNIWVKVDGGANYESSPSINVLPDCYATIAKADCEPGVRISGWTYGNYSQKKRGPVCDGVPEYYDGTVIFLYAAYDPAEEEPADIDSSRYSGERPEDAGDYVVKAVVQGTDNFLEAESAPAAFTISKAPFESEVSILGWTYGEYDEEINSPEISNNPGDAEVSFFYAPYYDGYRWEDYTTELSEEVPEIADTYVLKAVIAESENYQGMSLYTLFEIEKADISPRVYIRGWREGEYDAVINAPRVYGNKGKADVVFLYKEVGISGEYTETVPSAEGQYLVKAVVDESMNYNGAESEPYVFSIYEKAPEAYADPVGYDGLVYETGEDGKGVAQELVIPGRSTTGKGHFEYCVRTSSGRPGLLAKWSKETPTATDAGNYYVWYRFVDNSRLIPDIDMCSKPIEVSIDKATLTVGVRMSGWVYGLYNPLVNVPKLTEGSNPEGAAVTYEYKKADEPDSKYSKVVPILGSAGDYVVRATVAEKEGGNYYGGSAENVFRIKKAPAVALVEFNDKLVYNGSYQSFVRKEFDVGGEVEYKVCTIDDEGNEHLFKDYSTYRPTAIDAGQYRVYYRLRVDRNHYYNGEKSIDLEIRKAAISPEVSIEGWTYGDEPNEPVVTGNPGNADVDMIYSGTEAGGEPYLSREAPVNAGEYRVEVRVKSSANYERGEAVADFTVSKAALSITANDNSITYGDAAAAAEPGYTADGLKNGDIVESIMDLDYRFGKDTITGFDDYMPGDDAGEYVIRPVGPEATDNYEVSYADGTLTVEPAPLHISVNDSEIIYGEEPRDAGVTFEQSDFVNGDDESVLGGKLSYSFDGYKQYDDAGSYALTATGLTSDNYYMIYDSGLLKVAPRPLTFTWSDTSFAYDGKPHSPKVEADTVNGDELALTVNGGYETNAGEYTAWLDNASVHDSETGAPKRKNYTVADGEPTARCSWSIGKAVLTVTANDKEIAYGEAPSNAGVTYSGFVSGDSAEKSLKGSLAYSYSYKKNGKPGKYTITASGVSSDNYDVTFRQGSLTVDDVQSVLVAQGVAAGKTSVRLTWNDQTGATKYVVYGAMCDKGGKVYKLKKLATVKAGKLNYTKKKLKKNTCYKFRVVAYKGSRKLGQSELVHVTTGNVSGKYTNASSIKVNKKSVTVNKGSSVKVKATLKKANKRKKLLNNGHAALVRYTSSNSAVAKVDGNGNIYGVSEGYCKVYAQSVNGLWQEIEVTVR